MTNPKHTDTSRSGDLVKRLRSNRPLPTLPHEAADRIEALEAENERLRVQLADLANTINIVGSHYHKAQVALDDLVLDVKKRARAALQKETAETFTRSDNV